PNILSNNHSINTLNTNEKRNINNFDQKISNKNIIKNHPKSDSNYSCSESSSNPQTEIRRKLKKKYYTSIENNSKNKVITAVLMIQSTHIPDNYELYCFERVGKNRLKKQKRDIAYIPNAEKSKWLREVFINDTKSKLVNCEWRDDRRKWEPMSI